MKAKLQPEQSMHEKQIRTALNKHWHASAVGDANVEHDIYDDDAICDYPQSGERILGRSNLQALRSHHPGKPSGFKVKRIFGDGDIWITGTHNHVPGATGIHGEHHGVPQRQGRPRNTKFRDSLRGAGLSADCASCGFVDYVCSDNLKGQGGKEDRMQHNHKESRSGSGDTVSLTLKVGSALADLAEQIQQDIGRRAYELFEQRGYTHGDDLSDWFQAEKEIVQSVHSEVKDTGKQISLRVDVSNFDLADLQVGLYPRRLIVWGKRLATSGKNGDSADQDPKYLVTLSLVDLPTDVDMQNAKAVVKGTEIEVIAEKAHM